MILGIKSLQPILVAGFLVDLFSTPTVRLFLLFSLQKKNHLQIAMQSGSFELRGRDLNPRPSGYEAPGFYSRNFKWLKTVRLVTLSVSIHFVYFA